MRLLGDSLVQRLQVARQVLVDGRGLQAPERLGAGVWVVELRIFHDVVGGDEGVHGLFAATQGGGQEVDPERLVGLLGHVLGSARPEILVVIGVVSPSAWRCRSASCSAPSEISVQVAPRLRLSAT